MSSIRIWTLRIVATFFLVAGTGLMVAGPSFAGNPDLTTPEGAIAAYINGVAHQDFSAIIATTSADKMSKGFDFVANVDRLKSLMPLTPAPASAEFFIEINKANYVAVIARQLQSLTYGLMTTNEVVDGKSVPMDASGAAEFASVVRPDRLASLELLKVGIPNPVLMNSERHQANMVRMARVKGADTSTERVALLSFEGLHFVLGFSLLRYGNEWTIMYQSSSLANLAVTGAPRRVTLKEFEIMLK